jgi:hypothetical protein
MTEIEASVVQQVRAFKALHPASVLRGKRIASLVGREWDDATRQILDGLVERRCLTYTEMGGYSPNLWVLSRLNWSFTDETELVDESAFVLK